MIALYYRLLVERLKNKVPALRQIELFNNQYNNTNEELPFALPACLIEFESINWRDTGNLTQEAEATITFHIIQTFMQHNRDFDSNYYNTIAYETQLLQTLQDVHLALHGWKMKDTNNYTYSTELVRRNWTPSSNNDALHIWLLTYTCTLIDNTTNRDNTSLPFTIPALNIIPGA